MLPSSAGRWHTLPRAQAHRRSARWPSRPSGSMGRLHSPRAGLPSLSPDHGWPSDGFPSLQSPFQEVRDEPTFSTQCEYQGRGQHQLLRGQGRGVPQLGSILVSIETANSGCLLAACGVLGSWWKPEIVPSLPRGRGRLGSQGRTPLGSGNGGRWKKHLRGCQRLLPAG